MTHHLRQESRSKFTLCGHRIVPYAGIPTSVVNGLEVKDLAEARKRGLHAYVDVCPACALVASGTPKRLVRRAVAHDAQDEFLRAEVRQLAAKYREYLRANPEAALHFTTSSLGRSIERVCAAAGIDPWETEPPTKGARQ